MDIRDFMKELREGKEHTTRYVVVVNGERYATFDNEDDAIRCEDSFYNMSQDGEDYYGAFPRTTIIKEYEPLEESQAQEIGNEYRRLSKEYGIDFNDLVYGKDGFMKSMYPDNPNYVYFPDFNGDVIFSEKHWNELRDWALKNKGIKLKGWLEDETYGDELINDFETRHPWDDGFDETLKESRLVEAPDDMGFETDDEIEAQMKAEMEKRKAERDAKKQAELDRQERERAKQKAIEDAKAKGQELYDKCKETDDFDEWFDYLVPSEGKANTVAGEIYRALARIIYRDWNDGDKFYEGYGRETCGSSATYLVQIIDDSRITGMFYDLAEDGADDDTYTNRLTDIKNEIQEYLLNHPELFGELNEDDSRDEKQFDVDGEFEEPKGYEYQIYLGDYYWTDPYGEEIYLRDYINNEQCDIWKVIDTFKDFWFGDKVNFHIDRPWTHYDDTISINEMTKDSYETVKEYAEDEHLFDELIEELYNEYGDPNAEDEEEEPESDSFEVDEEE